MLNDRNIIQSSNTAEVAWFSSMKENNTNSNNGDIPAESVKLLEKCIDTIEVKEHEKHFQRGERVYAVSKKRWRVLALICALSIVNMFGITFFGFINALTSGYFRTSAYLTDLLSTITLISRGLFSLAIALISDAFNLRILSVGAAGLLTVGSALAAAGVSSRNNFVILIIGQIIAGASAAVGITVNEMTAGNWFPTKEQGFASGITLLFSRVSTLISNLVATRSLNISFHDLAVNNLTNDSVLGVTLAEKFGYINMVIYLIISAIAFVLFLLCFISISNYPPAISVTQKINATRTWNLINSIRVIHKLFINKPFLDLILHTCLILSVRPLVGALQSSIAISRFSDFTEEDAGTLYCVGLSIGAFGPPVGGILLDRYQRPVATYLFGIIACILGCCLYSLAISLESVFILYTGYAMINFFRDMLMICVIVATVKMTAAETPGTSLKIFCLVSSLPALSPSVFTLLIREVMTSLGSSIAVVVPIPFLALSGVLWILQHKQVEKKRSIEDAR